jgi:hypothetical protein
VVHAEEQPVLSVAQCTQSQECRPQQRAALQVVGLPSLFGRQALGLGAPRLFGQAREIRLRKRE